MLPLESESLVPFRGWGGGHGICSLVLVLGYLYFYKGSYLQNMRILDVEEKVAS
jgi:hypothetical protein